MTSARGHRTPARAAASTALRLGLGFWKKGDEAVIDGLGADALAANTISAARRVAALQTGYVYHYAFAMLVGVVALASWYALTR